MGLIAWAEAHHQTMIRDLVESSGLELIAVGSPKRSDALALSKSFGVDCVAEIRDAIQHPGTEVLWLASGEQLEPDERRMIRARGLVTFSSEPLPGSIAELLSEPSEAATAEFVPLMQRSPRFLAAEDALREFGTPRCVHMLLGCGPGEGSLFARLFDAMDLIDRCCGDVESVDAALAGPRATVPESLTGLAGHMTLNLRFTDRCCASIAVSDRSGRWLREITMLGEGGRLRLSDDALLWESGGTTIDRHEEIESARPGQFIGLQIRRRLDQRDGAAPPMDTTRRLALCEAARLSCRTGEGESPSRVLEMLSRV